MIERGDVRAYSSTVAHETPSKRRRGSSQGERFGDHRSPITAPCCWSLVSANPPGRCIGTSPAALGFVLGSILALRLRVSREFYTTMPAPIRPSARRSGTLPACSG